MSDHGASIVRPIQIIGFNVIQVQGGGAGCRRGLARSHALRHLGAMNEKVANILEQVYELTAAERAELIDALTEVAEAEELDPAYLKEIEDRLAAYDRGEVQGLDAYEVAFRRLAEK